MSELNLLSFKRRKKLMTKRVTPSWYQRYMNVLPVNEQVFLQPLKELREEEKMIKDAKPVEKSEDKTKELVKALENEKNMKIEMVLDLVAGDPEKMRERIALIKPSITPIKYLQDKKAAEAKAAEFQYTDAYGNPLSYIQYVKFVRTKHLKENSKWRLLIHNKVIKQKIRNLIQLKYQWEIQQKWKRAIRRVRAVLRFFQIIANIARTTTEVFKKFRQVSEKRVGELEPNSKDNKVLVFDKHLFKSTCGDRELDTEILFHLGKPEHYRTWEEAQKTAQALKFIRSFSILPEQYQERLAMIAWYMEVPADKVIIREGHVADSFYFLITGKVLAVKLTGSPIYERRSKFTVVKMIEKDDMFGEEGISNRGNRAYSVTSLTRCTLLSVNIDDYYRICNYCSSPDENPDHIRMLSQMDFMKYFPVQILIEDSEGKVIIFYYSKGAVITNDCSKSDYIYIVKAGTCKMFTSTRSLKPKRRYRYNKVTLPPLKAARRTTIFEPRLTLPECKLFPDISLEDMDPFTMPKVQEASSVEYMVRLSNFDSESYDTQLITNRQIDVSVSLDTQTSSDVALSQEKLIDSQSESNLSDVDVWDVSQNQSREQNMENKVISRKTSTNKIINGCSKLQVTKSAEEDTCAKKPQRLGSDCSSKVESYRQKVDSNINSVTKRTASKLLVKNGLPTLKTPYRRSSVNSKECTPSKKIKKKETDKQGKNSYQYMPGTTLNTGLSDTVFYDNPSGVMQKMSQCLDKGNRASYRRRRSTTSKLNSRFQKAGSVEKVIQTQKIDDDADSVWICLKTLRESDVFGLEYLELGDVKETNGVKVALVSEGSEIILVSKEFVTTNAGPAMKSYLRASSYILPDKDTILCDLKKREYWAKFQQRTIESFHKEFRN